MSLLKPAFKAISHGKLSIFVFHKVPLIKDPLIPNDIDQKKFQSILNFIESNFTIFALSDALDRLKSGILPPGSAAITFDDGYPDWREGAVRVLLKRSLPATFFITTGQFEGRPMWHERLANIIRMNEREELSTTILGNTGIKTSSIEDKIAALSDLEFYFKYFSPVIRDACINHLEELVGASKDSVPIMKLDDLIAISNAGFEIGSHTIDHPILGLCDPDIAVNEIARSREILELIIKKPVRSFAYPNGRPQIDYSHKHIEMVKAAGYEYAVTTQWGVANKNSCMFQLPRFTPWGPTLKKTGLQIVRNIYTTPAVMEY